MNKKKIKISILLPLITCTNLVSCNNSENKIHIQKVENLQTCVVLKEDKINDKYTTQYHFAYSNLFLYVTNNTKTIDNLINSYVQQTNYLIYRIDINYYNLLANNYNANNETTKFKTNIQNPTLMLISENKTLVSYELKEQTTKEDIQKLVDKYTYNSNIYNMNIDLNNKTDDNFVLENDITNTNLIYKDETRKDLDATHFNTMLGSFTNEHKFVEILRLTCGDCKNFSKNFIDDYYKKNKDKKLYLFDLFIFQNYNKNEQTQQLYDDSRTFLKETINLGFNYYTYNLETQSVPTKDTSSLEFRFPTIGKFTKDSSNTIKVDSIKVFANDEITKDPNTNKYYISKSFYNNKDFYSFANTKKEYVTNKLTEYQLKEIELFLENN